MSVMQEIYDNEVNISITTFWDGGYEVKLGDPMNGFVAERNVDRWDQVEPWLEAQMIKHFPDSEFAQARVSAA